MAKDKNITVVVIPADGSRPERLEVFDRADLAAMQRIVGGNIERIAMQGGSMYVNEDGLSLDLPRNDRAAELLEEMSGQDEVLVVGDVFLTGPGRDGWDTSAPQVVIDYVRDGERA